MKLININFKVLFYIAFISLITAFTFNFFSPKGLDLLTENNPENLAESDEIVQHGSLVKGKKIDLLSVTKAKSIFDNNNALFIDSRDPWDYSEGHIMNSINIPEFSFNPYLPIVKSLNKDGFYIVYCSSEECDLSRKLAVKLKEHGFKNIMIFTGGWEKWLDAKYPIFRK